MLLIALRAAARNWPALLAWFLAGWIARILLLQLAGWLGAYQAAYGLLVLPLAVLARLASYVGMFLVLRDGMPHFEPRPPGSALSRRGFAREWGSTVAESLLPFIIIYAAWGMIDEDIISYTKLSLGFFQFDTGSGYANSPLSVPFGIVSVALVVGAIALRTLLEHFEKRLPAFTSVITAYLEAVWVLVAALVVRGLVDQVPGWFATRRMFAGITDLVSGLRVSFRGAPVVSEAIGWLLSTLGDLVAQPLAWLALAAVVFSRALETLPARVRDPKILSRADRARIQRDRMLPPWAQRAVHAATREPRERWEPIAVAAGLVRRSGFVAFSTYVLGFAVVTAASPWLNLAISRVLGPHEPAFWGATDQPISLLVAVITTPLQLAIVAAAFDHVLGTGELAAVGAGAGAEVSAESARMAAPDSH